LPWQPILGAKSAYSPSFIALSFQNGLEHRSSNFRRFIGVVDFFTLFINLVRFGPATPEFRRAVGIQPLVNQQWSYGYVRFVAPLLANAVVSSQYCFTAVC